ncbi:MAG: PspC domain-containing protein [Clostridium sp.]
MEKKLYKIKSESKFAGVCAGIAEYLSVDVTLIRVLTLFLIIFSFSTALIVYIGCALIMPDKSDIKY